jgi:hypothetical protein
MAATLLSDAFWDLVEPSLPDIHEAFLSLGCALIYWQWLRKTWKRPERIPTFSGAHRQVALSWGSPVRAAARPV